MRLLTLTVAAAVALLASGCASTRPSPDELSRFRSVTLTNVVEESVSYTGKLPSEYEVDQGNGLMSVPLLAPVGLLIEMWNYKDTQRRKRERLKEIFADAKVDVVGAVRDRFERLAPSLVPASAVIEPAESPIDATVELKLRYGLRGAFGLGADWLPFLEVEATMRDQDGEEIWYTVEEVSVGDGKVHPLPFPNPFHSPRRVRAQYEAAADIVCRRLMADILAEK